MSAKCRVLRPQFLIYVSLDVFRQADPKQTIALAGRQFVAKAVYASREFSIVVDEVFLLREFSVSPDKSVQAISGEPLGFLFPSI